VQKVQGELVSAVITVPNLFVSLHKNSKLVATGGLRASVEDGK